MSDSSSSAGRSLVMVILILGGIVWLIQDLLTDSPAPKPVEAAPTSTSKAAIDRSQGNADAMNSATSDQLKSVQQMVGGEFDGQTLVLPKKQK